MDAAFEPDRAARRTRRLRRYAISLAVTGVVLMVGSIAIAGTLPELRYLSWPVQLAGTLLIAMTAVVWRQSDQAFDMRSDPGPDGVTLQYEQPAAARKQVIGLLGLAVLGVGLLVVASTVLDRVPHEWVRVVVVWGGVGGLVTGVAVAIFVTMNGGIRMRRR